ncbi:AAA family ATPase [Streptomyces sp. DSM 3412]|uniref:AAA family ATPase n=1 Tax=Streptomyces gottesmaniae TaxID=3075518 RepID=A0ABU2ZCL6_9ACTN|nr:helix-turn-helix transcriptional regulator [Streptomyces sp. DSM 3412]MDT0574328.1 AAA family ATPase [Streptomyces sp. DSM 3412]
MLLVERDEELHTLSGLLGDATAGRGRAVLISGAIAAGKTALLEALAHQAVDSGALHLAATGSKAERALQLGVVDQLFHSGSLPPEIAERASRLVTVEALPPGESELETRTLRQPEAHRIHQICALLQELSQAQPIVLTVDDTHYMDGASWQVLLYLQRRIRRARILLVLTTRQEHGHGHSPWHFEFTRYPHQRLRLRMLSERGVAELADRHLPPAETDQCATSLHRLSGGNPMLVKALLEDSAARLCTGSGRRLPATETAAFGQAVVECVHRCEAPLRSVAHALAVLGESASEDRLSRLYGLTPTAVSQALAALNAAGIVGQGFRHPASAAAILASLDADTRSSLHLRAAELLKEDGAAAWQIAAHLVEAQSVGVGWAMDTLLEAARQTLPTDRQELAMQCLALALKGCPDDESRTAVHKALNHIEWRMNPAVSSRHLPPLHQAVRDGRLKGKEAVSVVQHLLWAGGSQAQSAFEEVSAQLTSPADAPALAQLQLTHLWMYGLRHPRSGSAGTDREVPPLHELRTAGGSLWSRAAAVLSASMRSEAERVVDESERLLRSCQVGDETLEVIAASVASLTMAGRLDRAAGWCDALIQETQRSHARTWEALFTTLRADISLRQGDVSAAASRAEHALALVPPEGWGVVVGLPLSVLLAAHAAMGDLAAGAETAQINVPPEMYDTVFGPRYLLARGQFGLAADRVLAAVSDLQQCGDMLRERNLDHPCLVPWRTELARANLLLGWEQTARQLLLDQEELPGGKNPRARGGALRVLASASPLKQRPALLRRAVDALQSSGDRLELAHALADLSQAHHTLGEFRRARIMARRATQEAKASGAEEFLRPAQSGSADGEPAETGSGSSAAPALSDAERRVATLAALGHTNREIGRQLYITVSTVEQHLTRVYRKLNVSGRSDLPAGLSLQQLPGTAARVR